MTPKTIAALLWQLDPMQTGCCGVKEMQDEYELEAQEIASQVIDGADLRTTVVQVFDTFFWKDCLISGSDSSRLDSLVAEMSKILR